MKMTLKKKKNRVDQSVMGACCNGRLLKTIYRDMIVITYRMNLEINLQMK